MAPPSVAGIITACASVFTALSLLTTALTVLVPILRRTKRTEDAVASVHTLVNKTHDDSMARMAQLEAALRLAGVEVPVDPSVGIARP